MGGWEAGSDEVLVAFGDVEDSTTAGSEEPPIVLSSKLLIFEF